MPTPDGPRTGLQLVFTIFLGLMLTAFFGVGVYTFHPPPAREYDEALQQLHRDQQDVRKMRSDTELSAAARDSLANIQSEIREFEDARRERSEGWATSTSIVLVILATISMAVSLVRADQLRILSNGLLLGGVFTMLYGTGWIIASGDSRMRFWVMTAALVITVGLGYLRFVRTKGEAVSRPAPVSGGGADPELLRRIESLERRVDASARAMRGDD
jgi:hypothetical protein